jgi:DNA repair protein RecN (Recombination protein N)
MLEENVDRELADLNFADAALCVAVEPGHASEKGSDRVEFLIRTNRGEAFKPLAKIASGGELSRIMLAIKALSAAQSQIPSMVFDEIDTGISGRTAHVVAEKMADIARYRQVFCVTHLPQIAAMADSQYRVEKHFDGQRTLTNLLDLDETGRQDELARMLGGAEADSVSAKLHAQSMLQQAAAYKNKII